MATFTFGATVITANTRLLPTQRCRNDAEELGIPIDQVTSLLAQVANAPSVGSWPGRKSDQRWYQLDFSADMTLNILVQQSVETQARIITICEAPT